MEEIDTKLDKFSSILDHLCSSIETLKSSNDEILHRIEKVEDKTNNLAHGRNSQSPVGADDLVLGPTGSGSLHVHDDHHRINQRQNTAEDILDLQADFLALKDALQKIKLPADYLLNESKAGIRKEDLGTLNVLSKSARYSEVALKLLSKTQVDGHVSEADIKQLVTIHAAHMRYLQDEYANLVVHGIYPKEIAQMFRSLQKNTSGLSTEALKNLKLAVEVTSQQVQAHSSNSTGASYRSSQRVRSRGNYFGSRGRGQSHDIFDQFAPPRFNRFLQSNPANSASNMSHDEN